MANIYVRVPLYVAAFFRNADQNHRLTEWQPIDFEDFSYESTIIRQGMVDDRNKKILTVMCYSEQSWKNILRGKLPRGGKTVFIRDENKWPTAKEITALEGRSLKPNEELFDYLCISLPREMIVGGKMIRTPRSTSLDGQTAQRLANCLRNEFYQTYYEWVMQLQQQFEKRGLSISKAECMERFFAQYDIPMAQGGNQMNTMRMIVKRLFWRAERVNKHRAELNGEFFEYVSDDNKKKNAKEE